jgi:hypothetical protein
MRPIISLIGIAALCFIALVAIFGSDRCVPGRQSECRTVYREEGTQVCTSNGVWPDYCRRLIDGKLEVK